MPLIHHHRDYFQALPKLIGATDLAGLDELGEALYRTWSEGRCLFVMGNGGSAALASHMACDLGKGTIQPGKKRFRVMALSDNTALLTAWGNDAGYDAVFAEQLATLAQPGDAVLAISASGNSPNVLAGLSRARAQGCRTLGMGGFQGGKMKAMCDHVWLVPSDNMQLIEDLHVAGSHALFTVLRRRIQGNAAEARAAATGG